MLIAWLLLLQIASPPVGVEVFRSENGLNANALYGVLVDPNGFVWVNTDNGLYRYDGTTFRVAPSTLGREVVLANMVDTVTIAALSFDNSIDLIDIRRLSASQILSIPDSIKLNSFASTVHRFGDTLYVGTSDGRILTKHDERWRSSIVPKGHPGFIHNARVAMIGQASNRLVAATSTGTWFLRENSFRQDDPFAFISGKPALSTGKWWIPGRFDLYELTEQGFKSKFSFKSIGVYGFVHQAVWRNPSELWLATKEEGLVAIQFNKQGYTARKLLDTPEISGLIMDQDGTMWVSTLRDGLYQFHYWFDYFEHVSKIDGIRLGRTVFSSDQLIASEFNGAYFRSRKFVDGPIHFAKQVSRDLTVLGQIDIARFVTSEGRVIDIERIVREAGRVVQHPIKDSDSRPNLISLSAGNGVYEIDPLKQRLVRFYAGRSTSVAYLDSSRIAIGRPFRLDIIREVDGELLSSFPFRVTSLERLNNHVLLIGTNGDGLIRFDSHTGQSEMVLPGAWTSIHPIGVRRFAIVGSAGLFLTRFEETSSEFDLIEIPLTPIGFAQQVKHVRLSDDGMIWLSTPDGVLGARLDSLMKPRPHPRLRISEVAASGTELLSSTILSLQKDTDRLSISLAIQGEFNRQTQLLEYRFGNSESDWIPLAQPSIDIESIRKGKTVFEFRLRNVLTDEVISTASLEVWKEPHWWELPWVIALGVLLSLSTTVGLTVYTQRHLHRRKLERLAQEDKMREYERVAVTRLLTSHYLFNALATIRSVARRSTDEVNSYIGRLSKVIRALIDRTSQNDVDLKSELDWIRDYVALESVGRQLSIEFAVTVDEDLDPEDIFLPAFILQPVVENAMFHGAMNEDPIIRCDIRLVDKHLRIFVRNRIVSQPLRTPKNGSTSRGLQFMTERLKGWGRYHGFDLENEEVLSTRFTETEWSTEIILPFINHDLPLVTRS